MNHEALLWLAATLFWTALMSFYSAEEMACISCNRLRIDYLRSQRSRWAILLHELLENPTALFSTTLIGVNVSLMFSSESARRCLAALDMNPNWAAAIEIPFVLIFGELVPMFAARMYPEHSVRLGIRPLYLSATLLKPFTSLATLFFRRLQRGHTHAKQEGAPFMTREELQKILEEHAWEQLNEQERHVQSIIGNIFSLRNKQAFQFMQRVELFPTLSSLATVGATRELFQRTSEPCVAIFHRVPTKIIGVIYPQDLLGMADHKKAREAIRTPSFASEHTSAYELLARGQSARTGATIVLNERGEAQGVVLLDDVLDELFGESPARDDAQAAQPEIYLEKTFSADVTIADFARLYRVKTEDAGDETFAAYIEKTLGRHPEPNDKVTLGHFEIVVKETSLFKARTVLVRTKS